MSTSIDVNEKNIGQLFVVSTPIGNLADITLRALKTLETVDLILAEDTRHTAKLLSHFQLKKEMLSYRDQNHSRIIDDIVARLKNGLNIAIVTDAGTPTISDPGFKLVRDVAAKGFGVISIPGASAAIAALSVSGLPTDKFMFLGFLPKSSNKRDNILQESLKLDCTVILYESPYRLRDLIKYLSKKYPGREMCVVKDITKLYEKIYRGRSMDIIDLLPNNEKIKGEYTVLIAKE